MLDIAAFSSTNIINTYVDRAAFLSLFFAFDQYF